LQNLGSFGYGAVVCVFGQPNILIYG